MARRHLVSLGELRGWTLEPPEGRFPPSVPLNELLGLAHQFDVGLIGFFWCGAPSHQSVVKEHDAPPPRIVQCGQSHLLGKEEPRPPVFHYSNIPAVHPW